MKIAVSVTTYKKPLALKGTLETLVNITDCPKDVECIIVSDDNDGETQELVESFQIKYENGDYPYLLKYATGFRGGVAKNKNRGLRVFLEDCQADHLVMVDDDLKWRQCDYKLRERFFLKELLEAHQESKREHILGYISWGWSDPCTGNSYFVQFPPVAEDKHCFYCHGAQGILLSLTRKAVEEAGYMDIMPTPYGWEHILYSARINRLFGTDPMLFPVLKHCSSYFTCANIPNNYDIPKEELEKNNRFYMKRMESIFSGTDLKNSKWE